MSNDTDVPAPPDFIPSVSVEDLETAIAKGRVDERSKKLLDAEKKYINAWRKQTGRQRNAPENLTGLALSGGGIRSATFSLGVMQALAKHGLLKKFDYLSTVSGGGYIGSSITWLTSAKAEAESGKIFGVGLDDFPYGTDDPAATDGRTATTDQKGMLKYLRQHGNYLTPGEGIGGLSLVSVIVRGLLLNLLVWLPILTFIVIILLTLIASLSGEIETLLQAWQFLSGWLLRLSIILAAVFVVASVYYSLMTWLPTTVRRGWRYVARRLFETWTARVLLAFAVLLVLGLLGEPEAVLNAIIGIIPRDILGPDLGSKLVELRGVGFIVLGLAFAYWASSGGTKVPPNIIAGISSALVIIGIILVTFDVAVWLSENSGLSLYKLSGWSLTVWPLAFGVIVLAFVTGFFVNLNYISIHRYYRDRLMETFMPDIDKALDNVTGPAVGADSAFFHELFNPETPHSPYHIVNTTVVLVDSKERTRRGRGGDSFILSPSYCGSNATGWRPTNKFMDGKMTLATAMAISGAAANPNTGVGGTGITRNRLLSFLMAFLNLRLGYWVPHPTKLKKSSIRPNHFLPGLYEVVKAGYHEDRWFLQISDGGHFENLGLYELVRRRCRVIVVCDGGADADYSFDDLQVALRRILADFGAQITFDADNRPEKLIPIIDAGYPKGVMLAEQGHIIGEITYAKDEKRAESAKGTLIFLKTTLVSGLSVETLGYAGANRDFPDQTTLDQFFDEEQFEAYRELGYTIAKEMINDIRTNSDYDNKKGLREFIPKTQ